MTAATLGINYRERLGRTILVDADKRPLHKLNPLPSQEEIVAPLGRAHQIAPACGRSRP
jgi:hypothetical protein